MPYLKPIESTFFSILMPTCVHPRFLFFHSIFLTVSAQLMISEIESLLVPFYKESVDIWWTVCQITDDLSVLKGLKEDLLSKIVTVDSSARTQNPASNEDRHGYN